MPEPADEDGVGPPFWTKMPKAGELLWATSVSRAWAVAEVTQHGLFLQQA